MPPKKTKLPAVAGGAPDETEEAADATLIVTDGEREYRLRSDEFGPADTMACRQQTGLPVEHYLQNMGMDSFLVIIWLSRRQQGEPNLPFQKVLEKYPTAKHLAKLDYEIVYDGDEEAGPLADED